MPLEPSAPVAPAPAAPTPSPSPSPAPAAPSPGGGDGGSLSADDAFDKQFSLDDGPAPAPAAPAAPAPAKPTPAAPAKPQKTPPAAPAKPGAPAPAPEFDEVEGVQVPRFKSDKDFRGWGLNGYKKSKQLEADLAALQTKYTELESKAPKTEAERATLAAKLADIEKRYAELDQQLKFSNYQISDEYKNNYEKPYHNAIARAHAKMAELTVTEEDRTKEPDENGKYPTRERQATPADFDEVYSLPEGAAAKLAAKKFGPELVATILNARERIKELGEKAVGAIKEWKEKGATRAKEAEAQAIQNRQQVETLWTQVNNDIREKNKDLYAEREGDKGWNEALAKGTAMADAYFSDRSQHPIGQKVVFDAQVRNRIAAFPALVHRMRQLEAEVAAKAKEIADLRGSGPGVPSPGDPTPGAVESEGAMAEFDKKM